MVLNHCFILGTTGDVVHSLFTTSGVSENETKLRKRRPLTRTRPANISFFNLLTKQYDTWQHNGEDEVSQPAENANFWLKRKKEYFAYLIYILHIK